MTEDSPAKPSLLRLLFAALFGVIIAAFLFLVPLPFLIFAPGDAIDLNPLVVVPDHSPPPGTLFLTDVKVMPGRPAFYLAGKLLPGFEVVPRLQYAGSSSDAQFDRELEDAMKESQIVAQVVAERAAGLPVKTKTTTSIVEVKKGLPAEHCFKVGDVVESIDGTPPASAAAIAGAAATKPVGSRFDFRVERSGAPIRVSCNTAPYKGKRLFGVIVSSRTKLISLPVHVTYKVKGINGSSAGLMFALQIYRTLTGKPLAGGKKIAGTGVLASDGSVLPVGGALEKLHAAIAKGAQIFLVPKSDYPRIADTPGVTIIPVRSFDEALHSLEALSAVSTR